MCTGIYTIVALFVLSKNIQDLSASVCHEHRNVEYFFNNHAVTTKSTLTCFNVSSVLNLHLPPLYKHSHTIYDQELNITNSNVSILPPQAFSRFYQMKTLHLSGIKLKFIHANAFGDLTKVHTLHLENNDLTELRNYTFSGLHSVQFLDLSRNKIFKLEKGTFLKLDSLRTLHLEYNRLSTFDIEFSSLVIKLLHLDLSGNPLQKIPQISVSSLALSNISLTEFTVNDNYNLSIKTLTLSMNNLNTCDCFAFNSSWFYLTNLDLSHNFIVSINNCDRFIFNNLNLRYNRIEKLNRTFYVYSKFDLSHNRIKALKNLFTETLRDIVHLDLSYNEISTLDKDVFFGMSQIVVLNMTFNKIQVIPRGFFKSLQIRNLDLSFNKIENFQFGTFEGLTGLEILNVSNNQLLDLEPRLFHSLTSLETWYFDNNVISSFDADYVVAHFRELKLISLDHNSWNCEDLVRIKHLFENHGKKVKEGDSFDVENHYGIACISRVDSNTTHGYSFQSFHNYFQKIIDHTVVKSEINNFFNETFKNTVFFQRFNESKIFKPKTFNYKPLIIATSVQIVIYCLVLFAAVWFYMLLTRLNGVNEIVTSRLELVDNAD